jgi:DNA-directed RNA polymerase subunit RPC12/RpoP
VIEGVSYIEDTWYTCSRNCFEKVATQIESKIDPNEIVAEETLPPIHYFVGREIINQYTPQENPTLIGQIKNKLQKKTYSISFYKEPINQIGKSALWERLVKYTRLIQAKHFETLREFENAAKIYKRLGMYEEAGKIRAKRDELTIKRTDISLNLNALLQQVKDGGIVAVYRCPHCGGKLKISETTTITSLKICEHCGSEIESMDLADFFKTVLS